MDLRAASSGLSRPAEAAILLSLAPVCLGTNPDRADTPGRLPLRSFLRIARPGIAALCTLSGAASCRQAVPPTARMALLVAAVAGRAHGRCP